MRCYINRTIHQHGLMPTPYQEELHTVEEFDKAWKELIERGATGISITIDLDRNPTSQQIMQDILKAIKVMKPETTKSMGKE